MEINNDNLIEDNIVIAVLQKNGEISWIIGKDMTKKQEVTFKKIFAITQKPSIVLQLILIIELAILTIIYSFENVLGKKNGKK
jgi:hypothetical protein